MIFKAIIILFASINIYPQVHVLISVSGTYNSFNMTDEAGIQHELLQQLQLQNIPALATETFPAHSGMQFQLLFRIDNPSGIKYFVGPYLDIASTGGRIDYKDYSGEIKIDQLFKAYSFGITGEIKIPVADNFYLSPSLSIPIIFGSMQINSETRVGDYKDSQNYSFAATSFGLQPSIALGYDYSKFTIGLNLSYLLCMPTSYSPESNSEAFLKNNNGEKVTIGMNGLGLGVILGYNF
jgi:hypothetical protein